MCWSTITKEIFRTDLSVAHDPHLDKSDHEMDLNIKETEEKFCLEAESKQKR